jgi:hypothetical protein
MILLKVASFAGRTSLAECYSYENGKFKELNQ